MFNRWRQRTRRARPKTYSIAWHYGPWIITSSIVSASKIVSSVGSWLFQMENTLPRFDGTMNIPASTSPGGLSLYNITSSDSTISPYSEFFDAVTLYGAVCCGTSLLLLAAPRILQEYYPKAYKEEVNSPLFSGNKSEEESGTDIFIQRETLPCSYYFFVSMSWLSFGFQAIALFNGSIRLFDKVRDSEKDNSYSEVPYLMLAIANTGFQSIANYALTQKRAQENARSTEKILHLDGVSILIVIDFTIAALFSYLNTQGALEKLPFSLSGSVKSALSVSSLFASGGGRFITNGIALKKAVEEKKAKSKKDDSSEIISCSSRVYDATTQFFGIPDAIFTGINAFGALLFFIDPAKKKYQVSNLWQGSISKATVVSTAAVPAIVYGISTYAFNIRDRRQLNHKFFRSKKNRTPAREDSMSLETEHSSPNHYGTFK